jgi:cell division inhibitor SulA
MQLDRLTIDQWIQQFTKKPDDWPTQRTLHGLLHGGELHRFETNAHVLLGRAENSTDAHILSTTNFLKEKLPEEELTFLKDLLSQWGTKTTWLAWLQRDAKMTANHPTVLISSGLKTMTKKRINGWAISVGVKISELEALIRG